MSGPLKINWYRSPVDKALMSELTRKSDLRGFAQVIPQLALFALTGTISYVAFLQVHLDTWPWALPLVLLAVFLHGTQGSFFANVACHELCHKTPFATQRWNAFFLRVYSFLSWFDPSGYRASHTRHHQVTTHVEHDGEVVLPQGLDWHGVKFFLSAFSISPKQLLRLLRFWVAAAKGDLTRDGFFKAEWLQRVVPETNTAQRLEIVHWARVVLFGHLALASVFIVTGHWFLILIVNGGCLYCPWFVIVCGAPQHAGLSPNTSDFRLCCRTYTCSWFPAFFYWNMQYHIEHHMYPSVPFYHLPKLRDALAADLPAATHGLWPTWKALLPILRRQRLDSCYVYVPKLPNPGEGKVTAFGSAGEGTDAA